MAVSVLALMKKGPSDVQSAQGELAAVKYPPLM